MRPSRPSLLSGTLLLTATGLFSQGLGFLYRIALSRLIGAELMGLYQLIMPVYSVLLSLTAVGLTVAVSTLSARFQALGDTAAIRRVLRRGVLAFLALAVPLGMAVILLSDPISVHLLGDARTQLGVCLLIPCVLLTGVENLHKHCFYGMGQVRPPAASETVEQIIRAAAVLGLLTALLPQNPERTVAIIVVGMILCEVCSVTTLILLFRRQHFPSSASSGQVGWRRLFSIAVPVSCTSLLGTLMGSANSVLIPNKLVEGGMEAGQAIAAFGVLCGMTIPTLMLPTGFINALGLTMVPDLAQKAALGQRQEIRAQLGRVLTAISLLMAPAMALLTVVGPTLGQAMFRNPEVGQFMLPLAAGTLLTCWQALLSGSLNALGHQKQAARNAILCDGVQLAFTWCTVARWGLAGYVAGFLVTCALGFWLDLGVLRRVTGLRVQVIPWFLSPVLAAVLMGLCANLLFRWLLHQGCPSLPAAGVTALFGLVLYLAALQAQGFSLPRQKKSPLS